MGMRESRNSFPKLYNTYSWTAKKFRINKKLIRFLKEPIRFTRL